MPDYAAHEAVYFSQAITADDFAMKKNPKYVNKVVAPTLEPISSIGGFRTLPDYSFDTMPDDYVALVLIGGFGWNTPVAEKVMPIIKSAIEQEKVIGAIVDAQRCKFCKYDSCRKYQVRDGICMWLERCFGLGSYRT